MRPDDYDEVLIARGRRWGSCHLPHPDDPTTPACVDQTTFHDVDTFKPVDPATLAGNYELCSRCDPDADWQAQGTQGPRVHSILEREDVTTWAEAREVAAETFDTDDGRVMTAAVAADRLREAFSDRDLATARDIHARIGEYLEGSDSG